MNITEYLKRIEEKLDYIIEATGLEEINEKLQDDPNQLNFPWFQNYSPSKESDVLK
jgi:hypothetical protein